MTIIPLSHFGAQDLIFSNFGAKDIIARSIYKSHCDRLCISLIRAAPTRPLNVLRIFDQSFFDELIRDFKSYCTDMYFLNERVH